MNWQTHEQNRKVIGMTAAATAALAALGLAPSPAQAQNADPSTVSSAASVTLLTPFPGATFSGSKQIEISAFYQDTSVSGGITSVEILIDGQSAAVKSLDKPELRGVVSFLIDPSSLDVGTHQIVVRISSLSGEHSVVRTSIVYNGDTGNGVKLSPALPGANAATGVLVLSPQPSDHVSGIVTIKVDAVDPTGATPYVSVFIDKVFKSLRNHPPYLFDWDTTRTTNGWHTIEVSGFNDVEQLGKTQPVRVYVNNGGGDTTIDRGLADTPATPAPAPAPAAATAPSPAHLAKSSLNAPAFDSASPQELASASLPGGSLSDETMLSAPFLSKLPIPAGAPSVSSAEARLARPHQQDAASLTAPKSKQLASASLAGSSASDGTLLSSPFLSKQDIPDAAPSVSPSTAKLARSHQQNASAVSTAKPQRLASALLSQVSASDVTELSSPFLSKQDIPAVAPSVSPSTATLARSHQQYAFASSTAKQEQLASASLSQDSVSDATMLTSPFLSKQDIPAIAPSVLPATARLAHPLEGASDTIRIAPEALTSVPISDAATSGATLTAPAMNVLPIAPANTVKPIVPAVAVHVVAPSESVKPTAPALLARHREFSAAAVLPSPHMMSQITQGAVETDASIQAPIMSEVPIAPKKTAVAAVPMRQATPPAKLAAKTAPQPEISLGARLLASAGYVKDQLDPSILLSSPFVSKQAQPAAPVQPRSVKVVVAPPKLAVRPIHAGIELGSPRVNLAAAGLSQTPQDAPILSAPTPDRMHIDMTNVPHQAVTVARPACGIFSSSAARRLSGQYTVVMNDRMLKMDRPMQDHCNVLCAPIRQIFESQGGILFWSPNTKSVRAFTPERDVQLQIGSVMAKVNNVDQKLTVAPYISSGRTMIPVGFLPLALDVTVAYDATTGHLDINSKN